MSALIFLVILSVLVIVHELGHFVSARLFGMKVEEFGIGYPPRAYTFFKDKLGTVYTWNWLPFGGFVRLFGEDGSVDAEKTKGAFFTKPAWQRMTVILAGALMNFVFGALAFGAIYTNIGIPTDYGYVRIDEVAPGSPAQMAGLQAGDEVSRIVVDEEIREIETVDEFIFLVSEQQGKMIQVTVDNRQTEPLEVYVRRDEEIPEDEGAMGVVVSDFAFKHYPLWQMPFRGMAVGVEAAVGFGTLLIEALGSMVGDLVTEGIVPKDVAGPVGIVHTVEREGILDEGWLAVVNFAAILSINLAIVNVLPFPALDGGRAMMIAIEVVRGKRVDPEWEQRINTLGFMLLIGLIILISLRDIRNVLLDKAVQRWFVGLFS